MVLTGVRRSCEPTPFLPIPASRHASTIASAHIKLAPDVLIETRVKRLEREKHTFL
jgi:hypothetical protein